MNDHIDHRSDTAIRDVLARHLNTSPSPIRIASRVPVTGGCISRAERLELGDGRSFFLKTNDEAPGDMFAAEAAGLEALRRNGQVRAPKVIGVSLEGESPAHLLLEWIPRGHSATFENDLGAQLALMHQASVTSIGMGDGYGFPIDNYLGSTPQTNGGSLSWLEFWRRRRLEPQLNLARQRSLGGDELQRLGNRLMERLGDILGEPSEPPSLVHGDLWSGNFYAAQDGAPVLIDPACYIGNREAEFGMLTLFGGLSARFYDAYQAVYPLADGADERIAVYRLHHLLNHLNLFGASYLSDCLSLMRRLN